MRDTSCHLRAAALSTIVLLLATTSPPGAQPTAASPSRTASRRTTSGWTTSGWTTKLESSVAHCEACRFPRLRSVLVLRHGKVVLERYWNGAGTST